MEWCDGSAAERGDSRALAGSETKPEWRRGEEDRAAAEGEDEERKGRARAKMKGAEAGGLRQLGRWVADRWVAVGCWADGTKYLQRRR